MQFKKLGETIKEGNKMSLEEKALALIFLHHHIHEDLQNEYLTKEDPVSLWKSLKDRYDHQKMVILLMDPSFSFSPSSVPGPPGCGRAKRKKRASINICFLYGYARFSILLGI